MPLHFHNRNKFKCVREVFSLTYRLFLCAQGSGEYVQGTEITGSAACWRVCFLPSGLICVWRHSATSPNTPVPLLMCGDPGTGAHKHWHIADLYEASCSCIKDVHFCQSYLIQKHCYSGNSRLNHKVNFLATLFFVSRCLSRAMQRNVAAFWRPFWSRGVFVHSFPPSSLPTLRPMSSSFSTKMWWHHYTSTVLMSSLCCSQRLAKTKMSHSKERWYTLKIFQSHIPLPSLRLQFDLFQWLNEAHPVFSERTRLLELVHGALCVCGRDPEPELLTPFHLFTKHWTWLLRHHFPDHYSDCLRLLMTSECVCVFVCLCTKAPWLNLMYRIIRTSISLNFNHHLNGSSIMLHSAW